MKIFISWSGTYSHEVAKLVNNWLPCVLQGVSTFLSSSDIDAGAAWNDVIRGALHDCDFGILFVTQQNVHKPWVLFEAGALAKNVSESLVVPIFIDVDEKEFALSGSPLINLNRVHFEKAGLKKLLNTINSRLENGRLKPETLGRVFDKWWEELNKDFKKIEPPKVKTKTKKLSDDDRLSRIEDALASLVNQASGASQVRKDDTSGIRKRRMPLSTRMRRGELSIGQARDEVAKITHSNIIRNIQRRLNEAEDEFFRDAYMPILDDRLREITGSE